MATEKRYLEAPVPQKNMPSGISYIVGNEAAERFSYYGMKAILVVFMTQHMLDSQGNFDVMSEEDARFYYHLFGTAVYFFPILGSIIADAFLGKYKTILSLSVVYCLGHLCLALDETRMGLALGLTLIAIGSGGIKPCVSAHVGDQFGKSNSHLLEKVFQWFYFSINLGAFASTLLTPWLLANYGPSLAFGIPGALMLIATFVFWLGRNSFVHIPAHGLGFVKETLSGEGLKTIARLAVLYCFVAMFWALFDQTGSAWVLQAESMDREFLGITWLSSQIQAMNPILIMMFIPIFGYFLYPAINKVFPLTPLRKISIGFFVTLPAFLLPAWIEMQIQAGDEPNIIWQLLSYIIITAAEVLVSITALEFSYTQAPKKMKSFVMGLFLMSVSIGNLFTAGVNLIIQEEAIVAEVDAKGSREVDVSKDTTYALLCAQGDISLEETTSISVAQAIKKNEKANTESKKPALKLVSFTANKESGRTIINPGEKATLSWKAEGAESCKVSPPGAPVDPAGTQEVQPEKTTTYVFSCKDKDNNSETQRMKVVVNEGVAIKSFSADKSRLDPPGGKATLSWEAVGPSKCQIIARSNRLDQVGYYLFFAFAMLITAILFVFVAMRFPTRTYIQDEGDDDDENNSDTGTKEAA